MSRRAILAAAIVSEGAILLVAWLQGWLFGVPPFAHATFTWMAIAGGVAGTVPLFLAMWWTGTSSWPPAARLREQIEEVVREIFVHLSVVDIAVVSMLAGVAEEALFRGVLQTAFGDWINPAAGLAIASVLFGLVHFVTPLYAVLAGVIGVWLGGMFLVTGNLLAPIVAHALYDFVALMWLVRDARASGDAGEPGGTSRS